MTDPTRPPGVVGALRRLLESTDKPPAPLHGGVVATSRTGHDAAKDRGERGRDRQRRAMQAIAAFLGLPADRAIDIEVDLQHDQVTFRVSDRDTGELLREVPEADARVLVEQLRELHGTFVDRSL
ncbi:MAG TPA: flagellar protein FlaG [Planctomycetota bacterium]|nr:flagellar protein FlaG [Planctomycetota bacterium]